MRHEIRAPREQVFRAWTQPEHLKRWLGATRLLDAAGGHRFARRGRYRIAMQPPEGDVMYITGVF